MSPGDDQLQAVVLTEAHSMWINANYSTTIFGQISSSLQMQHAMFKTQPNENSFCSSLKNFKYSHFGDYFDTARVWRFFCVPYSIEIAKYEFPPHYLGCV